jgi:L-malate glycosyltransferase
MTARTKICITTPEFPPEQWGGLARTAWRVALCAAQLGMEVHVAAFGVADGPVVLFDENRVSSSLQGITIHRITLGRERFPNGREVWDCPHNLTLQMMYQSLEMLNREIGFDLLHSFFLYPVGYVTGLFARRFRVPCLVTIVGNDVKKYAFSPEKAALCMSGLQNADMVVALSRELMEMADALVPVRSKSRVVYNSVEIPPDSWTPCVGLERPTKVGCAGIFKYAKGLPYLFKAVGRLLPRFPLILEMRGTLRDSEKEVYAQMLARTGITDAVRLLEPLPHDRVPEWLRSLDLFVLPSVSEGCPNILMEAMASGVPTIGTGTGAIDDLVEHNVSGLVVPWGDSAALADAMERMLISPQLAARFGAAGRERMKLFSPEREYNAWKEVYADLECCLHEH